MLKIEIPNWGKYNPRKDRGNFTWFRLDNEFLVDPMIFSLNHEEIVTYLFCCTAVCKAGGRGAVINPDYAAAILKIKHQAVLDNLITLEQKGLIYRNDSQFDDIKKTPDDGAKTPDDGAKTPDDGCLPVDARPLSPLRDETRRYETRRDGRKKPAAPPDGGSLPLIASLWNQNAPNGLAHVESMSRSSKRRLACNARWQELPDQAYWIRVIRAIGLSPFLMGQNDRKWKADLEFLVRPDSAAKIIEGKYGKSLADIERAESVRAAEEAEKEARRREDEAESARLAAMTPEERETNARKVRELIDKSLGRVRA